MDIDQFSRIFPSCRDATEWVSHFDRLVDFGITQPNQIANFCAQVGHESMDLNVMQENLNHSSDRLRAVFPKYFRSVDAKAFHRNPEKIANWVYANRMGNGPPESGDGWSYRGSGIIQLTGKDNFAEASDYLYSDSAVLLDRPELVREDKEIAILCALWFWAKHNLMDIDNPVEVSRIVNGGDNGLDDRISRYEKALGVLTSE